MISNTTILEDLLTFKKLVLKHKNTSIEIVLNKCYGGFSLSKEAYEYLGIEWDGGHMYANDRTHPKLIEVVKTLGKAASGCCSELYIDSIDFDEILYTNIDSYDGNETLSKYDGYSILEHYIQ